MVFHVIFFAVVINVPWDKRMLSDAIILKYWLTDEIAILPDDELEHTFETNTVNKSLDYWYAQRKTII